jgi:hypothetical protein
MLPRPNSEAAAATLMCNLMLVQSLSALTQSEEAQ